MLGHVSGWTLKQKRQFRGEFIREKSIFSCKPWFKRLAGISTTGCMYPMGFAAYFALGQISKKGNIYDSVPKSSWQFQYRFLRNNRRLNSCGLQDWSAPQLPLQPTSSRQGSSRQNEGISCTRLRLELIHFYNDKEQLCREVVGLTYHSRGTG